MKKPPNILSLTPINKPKEIERFTSFSIMQNNNKRIKFKQELWENMHRSINSLGKCKAYAEFLFRVPQEIESFICYDKISIMLISNAFSSLLLSNSLNSDEFLKNGIKHKSMFYNSAWYNLIYSANHKFSEPQYSNFGQLAVGRKT